MTIRRSRLRIPSLLAATFWLLTGVADAAAIGACAYHGISSEHDGVAGHVPEPGVSSLASHEHHDDPQHAETVSNGADRSVCGHAPRSTSIHASTGSEGPIGGHDCDCRTVFCAGVVSATPVEPSIRGIAEVPDKVPGTPVPSAPDARIPSAILPFFLPPSIAPPPL